MEFFNDNQPSLNGKKLGDGSDAGKKRSELLTVSGPRATTTTFKKAMYNSSTFAGHFGKVHS